MSKLRSLVVVMGVSAALLLPVADAFAGRGGGRGGGGRGGGGMGGGGRGGGGMGGNQQPQENPIITADRTQVTTDSAALNVATTAYNTALTAFKTNYMKQPDYSGAQKAVDDANKQVDAARLAVIAKLKTQSDYKAASLKESDAKKKLDTIRANGGNRDQISAQAQLILDAGDAVSKIEADALAKDVAYQDAKKTLADAMAALDVQKTNMATAVAGDADLTSKKATMDTAKTTLTDAQTKLKTDSAQYGG